MENNEKGSGCLGTIVLIFVLLIIFASISISKMEKEILSNEISDYDKQILKNYYSDLDEKQQARFNEMLSEYNGYSEDLKQEIEYNFNRLSSEHLIFEEEELEKKEEEAKEKQLVEDEAMEKNKEREYEYQKQYDKEMKKQAKKQAKDEENHTKELEKIADKKDPLTKKWNVNNYDGQTNGNISKAGEVVSTNSNDEFRSLNEGYVEPQYVIRDVWKYYGRVVTLSGRISSINSYAPDSNVSKTINNGNPVGEILMINSDGTAIVAYVADDVSNINEGMNISVYGLPTGLADLTNGFGGNSKGIVIVGKII